ncbi:helix-turn-helix transcriptional regulator [Rothia uropygialis]|uniref:helix-turn-helix transcriptional regulator n=1 Tax=Kocuria sp. 36 TaxID=1415402 RepID=UPI00101BE8C7|nr:helix-turn-helix transcriptional regulator [Kocuria sp. 36]
MSTSETGPQPLSSEDQEWVEELTANWIEVYKKSATTLALLRIVRDYGRLPAPAIRNEFVRATGWSVTERGFYRTLKRLADSGALSIRKVDIARTGAKRHDFELTPLGHNYLRNIEQELM